MRWQKVQAEDDVLDGSDVYYQWRRGAGRRRRPTADLWRPVILRLEEHVEVQAFAEGRSAPDDWAESVRIPSFYLRPCTGLGEARYLTALVREPFFESLRPGGHARDLIERLTVLPPIVRDEGDDDPPSVPESDPAPAPRSRARASSTTSMTSRTVVMGVIDFGIAFAHQRFRSSPNTTRIQHVWVQDGIPRGAAVARSASELDEAGGAIAHEADILDPDQDDLNSVPYGHEISAPEIDGLLEELARGKLASEDSLYRRASASLGRRWWRSVARRAAHGTHVMDLACGYGPGEEVRERRPIIAVQLPEAATADTSGETLDAYVLDGIRYILDRADALTDVWRSGPLPVVINFSYGDVAGPHDGSSDLEQAIDELIRAHPNLSVVIPAGNSHLARLHAAFDFPRPVPAPRDRTYHPGVQDLRWRVLPDDRTPSFVELWLPRPGEKNPWQPGDPSRVSLTITAPGGEETSEPLGESDGAGMRLNADGEVLCEARYRYIREPRDGGGRGMFLIALQPTVRTEVGAPIAPSGVWTVRLENVSLKAGEFVEAWIQRDDTPFGFRRRGRQSYFDQPCYHRFDRGGRMIEGDPERFDCVIKRAGSMNAIATGERTVVVGGYVRGSGLPARYSAGGPKPKTRPASWKRDGPDVLAVSDESLVHQGILAAGIRSGSVVSLNGTSVAAPQVARRLAIELSNGTEEVLATGFADPEAGSLGRSIVRWLAESAGPQQPSEERGGSGFVGTDEIDRRQRRRRRRSQAPHSSGAQPRSASGAADRT